MLMIKTILATLLLSAASLLSAQTMSGSGLAVSGNGLTMGNSTANCTILTASLPNSTQGISYSRIINTSNCTAPLTWAVLSGSAPTGTTLTTPTAGTVGTLSGTLSAAGTFNFTVKVTDNNGAVATQLYGITVAAPCAISTTTLSNATTGNLYSQPVNNVGCVAPLTWTVSVGSLPPGITQDATTGVLSGSNPTTPGTYNFTVHVVDNLGNPASQPLSIIVVSGATCMITSPSTLVIGVVGSPYSSSPDITTTSCTPPLAFAIQPGGTIPVGTTLNPTTGVISGNPTTPGTSNFTAQVTDSLSNVATKPLTITISGASGADNSYCTISGTWVGLTTDGPVLAHMPTACNFTALSGTPAPGTVWPISTSLTMLQSTVNAAACGDRIPVQQGLSATGTLALPAKGCDNAHWIWIYSTGISDPNFPVEGTRATPAIGGVASLPNRPAFPCPNCPTNLSFTINAPASSNAIKASSAGADHYRFMGAQIGRVPTQGAPIYNLVDLTVPATGVQASNIIWDRVWFRGINRDGQFPTTQATDTSTTRAVYLGQSNHISVVDSYFSDFYDTGGCQSCVPPIGSANGNTDAQCIGGGAGGIANSGWGIYKFVNNHCEASGEGILLGGSGGPKLTPAGCTIMVNCNLDVPTDIEVRRNYFFKPVSWNGNTTVPAGAGWPVIKNGFEMKMGARALFEGNVIENTFYGAQVGWCWSTAPKNQSNGGIPNVATALTALTNDFTYRYNYCHNVAYGIGLYQSEDAGCANCQAQGANRISIHDNIISDALNLGSLTAQSAGDGAAFTAAGDISNQGLNQINNVYLAHNLSPKAIRYAFGLGANSTGQYHNWIIQNNIFYFGNFGVGSNPSLSGCSTTNQLFQILNNCMGVSGWTVDHNAVFNWTTGTLGSGWPTNGSGAGNFFYSNTTGPQFTNYNGGNSGFNPSNYILLPASPLHNAASDGHDLGPDIPTLNSKISGVRQ